MNRSCRVSLQRRNDGTVTETYDCGSIRETMKEEKKRNPTQSIQRRREKQDDGWMKRRRFWFYVSRLILQRREREKSSGEQVLTVFSRVNRPEFCSCAPEDEPWLTTARLIISALATTVCVVAGHPPLARWSSSLGHWPPSHQRLFRISSRLLSCSCRIPRVISSLNGEPEEEDGYRTEVSTKHELNMWVTVRLHRIWCHCSGPARRLPKLQLHLLYKSNTESGLDRALCSAALTTQIKSHDRPAKNPRDNILRSAQLLVDGVPAPWWRLSFMCH